MNKLFESFVLAVAIFSYASASHAQWEGDEIGATVSGDAIYQWPQATAVVSFSGPEYVNQLTNLTITADFTEDLLVLSYENTSASPNITVPALQFTFLGLDVGGTGILGLNLVQSNFTQAITPISTVDSITLDVPMQNTNPGEIFTAVFQIVTFIPNVTLTESVSLISFDYGDLGTPNTGFSIANPTETLLDVVSAFEADLGLLSGEAVQPGFVIYDGTLLLEVAAVEPQSGRENFVTTYRMNVDPRMLRRDFLRARYLRQGVFAGGRADEGRAAARAARAARLSDARIMRFLEDEGRWVRAARVAGRASGRRIQPRFFPRMEPDGVVGHYGTFEKADGTAYVWAVMDRNSRYTVGLNSDDDNDGIFNGDDNCRNHANPNQLDTDNDGLGNECDPDDDGDGVDDENDNCPMDPNANQADQDGDGAGDACDSDSDGDGVPGDVDACPNTFGGDVVDETGCSIADACPCDSAWKNHGAYVRCVAHQSNDFLKAGLISSAEKDLIMDQAGSSECGKSP